MKTLAFLLVLLINSSTLLAQEYALVRENGKFGFIDKTGAYVIEPQFDKADSFSDGRAAALQDDKWGYIDISGKFVIQPEYDRVKMFNSGLALVLKDDQWRYIDTSGKELKTPASEKYYDFEEGVALFRSGEKIGLLGTDGQLILEPTYDAIKKFRNGHAKVSKGELWGMINTSGKVVIPVEYEEIGNTYKEAGVYGKKDGTFGIIHNGSFNPIDNADKVYNFHGDSKLTYASRTKKTGFVNSKGEWVLEPKYDKARAFSLGLAPVAIGKKWGYINEKGEMVIEPQFRDAEVFSTNGFAPVKDKAWGFINTSGKVIIPMEYGISGNFAFLKGSEEKGFVNGLARVKSKKGWGYFNEQGQLLGDKWFQNAEPFVSVK
ncbi:WG repeat-containing protein [Zobellia galactanivorans]|uniref:KGW repeats protein n=1 Tax=Zobellia galactanivorans (strain DSM 12802 / CCUG 47099 / CIP 106680 / NCIMB 13871 / Dsij) TaxID=63186 RepID=G0L5E8_ZOBGA|nr:WG repeat-containing protein [Zobellia galactanivorans]CAZ96238.1 KGW repeats protein [Zobellia galactanivorans]